MSIAITLPCGCQITDTCVVAMCIAHVFEFEAMQRAELERRESFHRMMRESIVKAMEQRS